MVQKQTHSRRIPKINENMKHRRKRKHRVWRKDLSDMFSVGSWSRMLHKWWKIDATEKREHDKRKFDSY